MQCFRRIYHNRNFIGFNLTHRISVNGHRSVATKYYSKVQKLCYVSHTHNILDVIHGRVHFSTQTEESIDSNLFETVCEETLQSLTDFFEELVENEEQLSSADVSYSSGVLTVNLGHKFGTYVINRQSPNKQIWLSSPKSGPKRYDFVSNGGYWIYKHDQQKLHDLLRTELTEILGKEVNISNCVHSSC